MIIRRFQPEDLEPVLHLFHDVVHTVGSKYYNAEQIAAWAPPVDSLDREKWLRSLKANISYIAEDNGKIIGFADMTQTGYFDRLYVHKNYQGRGIALALFNKIEDEARKLGLTELSMEASIMLKPLAERVGFIVIQEQRKIHRGIEFITYLMHKKL
jgi:putative acetyltransferase